MFLRLSLTKVKNYIHNTVLINWIPHTMIRQSSLSFSLDTCIHTIVLVYRYTFLKHVTLINVLRRNKYGMIKHQIVPIVISG